MARSPEYPDLTWVQPKSWTNANREAVQLIVIHDTEGSAHAQSAEDGAAYDARRTDGTSAHYFVDNTSIVQCVRTNDQAHTARRQGNRRGIHYELCAKASFTRAQWLSAAYGRPMLERAAAQVAKDCHKWGIPVRKVTPDQVADGVKGICGHADITKAFPADGGTHTDPGRNFPWDDFIDMVRAEYAPEQTAEDEDMAEVTEISDAAAKKIAQAVLNQTLGRSTETVGMDLQGDDNDEILAAQAQGLGRLLDLLDQVKTRLTAIEVRLNQSLPPVPGGTPPPSVPMT